MTTAPAASNDSADTEQAVLLTLPGWQPKDAWDLEDELESTVDSAGVGDFDGDEYDMRARALTIYLYGPDADKLLETVMPALDGSVPPGSTAVKRYGAPGAKETTVNLT